MGDNEEEEEVTDLSNPDVTTKYMSAAGIVNKALQLVIDACVEGADVAEVCEKGDTYMDTECGKLYNNKKAKKKVEKGVAYPTCISMNDIIGHFSPLKGESKKLANGDICKIEMACHLDGYIASAGHTIIVGGEEVSDKRADVIHAAWTASEAVLRLMQVGNKNTDVAAIYETAAQQFKCTPLKGLNSYQMKKHVIHGNKVIASKDKDNPEEKVEQCEFEMNEVYCIDVLVSSGEGKGRETEMRSTVFKRAVENSYVLKIQKARQFLHEVNKRFPTLPFSIRAFEDETVAKVGVSEAKRHDLLHEYPVTREREGEVLAQFKYTVLLLPGGTKRITGLPFGKLEEQAKSKYVVEDDELKKLLATSANPKKKKKAKKETGGYAGGDKDEKEG